MDRIDMLLEAVGMLQRVVGRIEGKMQEIPDLSRRVSSLETWQNWLKGGWAAVVVMYFHAWRGLGWR